MKTCTNVRYEELVTKYRWKKRENITFCLNCPIIFTLDGWWANNKCLLEGLGLGAELGGSGLQRNSLLGQTRDVDGGLLVEARLIVQQWDITTERQGLASCRGHLEDTTKENFKLMPKKMN